MTSSTVSDGRRLVGDPGGKRSLVAVGRTGEESELLRLAPEVEVVKSYSHSSSFCTGVPALAELSEGESRLTLAVALLLLCGNMPEEDEESEVREEAARVVLLILPP